MRVTEFSMSAPIDCEVRVEVNGEEREITLVKNEKYSCVLEKE